MYDRVEFFESNDLLYGHNLVKIETLSIPDYFKIDINDAIEFYEIKRYFDNGTRASTWSDKDFQIYQEKSKKLYELTMRFFNAIDDTTVVQQYSYVELSYQEEFWTLFDICKLPRKISDCAFEHLIHSQSITSFDLFRHNSIVTRYGTILRNYILESLNHISILTHVYNQDFVYGEKLFLPNELSGMDICSYFEEYIESDSPNPNILDKIFQMHPSQRFPVSDELRLKARRRYSKEIDKLFHNSITKEYGIQLSFDKNQTEEKKAAYIGDKFYISYSTQWLLDTLDFPSILNNFVYIFEYVDVPQMRFLHVSKASDLGALEQALLPSSSRMYPYGLAFEFKNSLAKMQMYKYYNFLKANSIRLEDVLKWVFTEYLQAEYDCPEIRVLFPSENTTYTEKCLVILPTIESIIKQFALYVKNGKIDFELVSMSTAPIRLAEIPSLTKRKYIYGAGRDFEHITFLLFSNQCLHSYIPRIHEQEEKYECFFDLIQNESVFLSDYREREHASFRYLKNFDLVSIAENGQIVPENIIRLTLLKDLYRNDVVSKWRYPNVAHIEIQDLLERNVLTEKDGLLSVPESNYLNYLLNRSEYDNGLEIRNKYAHGIQQVNINEAEHQQNYFTLLRICVLLAIKINDDFELKEISEK